MAMTSHDEEQRLPMEFLGEYLDENEVDFARLQTFQTNQEDQLGADAVD